MLLILMITLLVLLSSTALHADAIPRSEHPRPDFKRETWLNLNGAWYFDFDPNDEGEASKWFIPGHKLNKQINVPFPWQSPLSGIEDTKYAGAAWYSREIIVPEEWTGKRAILKFGAVDWDAKIWVNGKLAGEHSGGYTPFEIDITDFVEFGKPVSLVVRVYDPQDIDALPVGKQFWYTRTSGLWQTVYLEARNSVYLSQCHISPDVDGKKADFAVKINAPQVIDDLTLNIQLTDSAKNKISQTRKLTIKQGESESDFSIDIADPKLWSPESPQLYEVTLTLMQGDSILDQVSSYFGMRKVEAKLLSGTDYQYVYLNDKPIYLRGALNQAFHPEGIYTYPNQTVIRQDLMRAKEWGFNFLRMHIKIDDPLFLYWADKIGVILMCDVPNFADKGYGPDAKTRWEQVFRGAVERDYNHPSIFFWCLFNETWGFGPDFKENKEKQDFMESMYHLAKSLDKTRLIEEMSPCNFDHVATDLNDWHFYINDYKAAKDHLKMAVDNTYPGSGWNYVPGRKQTGVPFLNGEYGGIAAFMGDREVSWCFKFLTNEIRLHEKICGYVYTELMDIEWEYNGMMRYDRSRKEFGYAPKMINAADVLVLDTAPGYSMKPGDKLSFEAYSSHFSEENFENPVIKWALEGTDALGRKLDQKVLGSHPVTLEHYHVRPAGKIEFTAPENCRAGLLKVWIEDAQGRKFAENFISLVIDSPLPKLENADVISFIPGNYKDAEWTGLLQSIGFDINTGWKFKRGGTQMPFDGTPAEIDRFFDDSTWEDVDLPHWWPNPQPGEHGWYRKKIRVGDEHTHQNSTLSFGPITVNSRIYLNDHLLGGLDDNWDSNQSFQVSDKLVQWDNTIAIFVQNTEGSAGTEGPTNMDIRTARGVGMSGPVNVSIRTADDVWAEGAGYLRYEIPVKSLDGVKKIRVRLEASAEEPGLKQTDEKYHPSDLTILMEGIEIKTIMLPDAPCDLRGTVSRINEFRDSKYGYLIDETFPPDQISALANAIKQKGSITLELRVKSDSAHQNGLLLFGRNAGRYGMNPMLILEK